MPRGEVLVKAIETINGDRQDQYGNPEDSFSTIAKFWQVYREDALVGDSGYERELNSKDVAMLMALLKIAREMHGAGKEDNMIDAAGYIGLAADMSNYNKKENNND